MKYDNTNRGALFRNDDKHADHRGNVNVEGTKYWIDAWINESKKAELVQPSTFVDHSAGQRW